MIFSIVTVTFNDKKNFRTTLNNVLLQKFTNYEYIIIDGASSDGTLEIISEYEDSINYWISSPDNGIYDAMNKALKKCSGDYVLFLNAGDTFVNSNTLKEVALKIEENNFPDFIYGDALEIDLKNNTFLRPARNTAHKKIGMFTHHQSMYYKNSVINKSHLEYDLKLEIAADYKFTCQFLESINSELYIKSPLCIFLQGGLSQTQWLKSMKEQIIVKRDVLKLPVFQIYMIFFAQVGWHFLKEKVPWIHRLIRFKK